MGDASKKRSTFAECLYAKRKTGQAACTSVVVIDKSGGRFRELKTVGISSDEKEVAELYKAGKKTDSARLIVGYSEKRAKKDRNNRDKGIKRLEKEYENTALTLARPNIPHHRVQCKAPALQK